jgi:hypothetical protein
MTYKAYICLYFCPFWLTETAIGYYHAKSFPSIAAYVLCEKDQVAITYIKEL